MKDSELLELAAKAAGYELQDHTVSGDGLWLYGEKDIQIPIKLCIEQLNTFKVQGKPFEYALFSTLGHNTSSNDTTTPFDISIQWIKQKALNIKKFKSSK